MGADINALGGLRPVEELDLSNYADNQAPKGLPPAGVYTLQAPDSFPPTSFDRAQSSGAITVQIDPKIVGPTNEGYTLRFTKVSAKSWKRGGVPVSQLGDYLRAFGIREKIDSEEKQLALAESTANRVYQAEVDWKGWNKNNKREMLGMENAIPDGKGGYEPYFLDNTDLVEVEGADGKKTMEPRRLRANLQITRFIPLEG